VVINLTNSKVSVKVPWNKFAGKYYDYATNKQVSVPSSQTLSLSGWGYKVYSTNQLSTK
jgi:serine protease inhibitor ecotin